MSRASTLRVGLYARVSTRDRDQDPDLQLVPMREYAATRGWTAIEYVDHASAADLRGRAGWTRLLEDARARRLDAVMVWKLDRAFRSSLHAHSVLAQLEHEGVGFRCHTQEIDTTTSTGRLVFAILAAVAEMERDLIRERVKEGMQNARRKGVHVGRPSAAARPDWATQWPRVQKDVLAGKLSVRRAAKRLGVAPSTVSRAIRLGQRV